MKSRDLKRAATFLMSLIMVLLMASCGASDSAPAAPPADTSGSEGAGEQDSGNAVDNAEYPQGDWVIGACLTSVQNTYTAQEEKFLDEAAEYLVSTGQIKEMIKAVAEYDVATQISQMQDFIMRGVDAIVLDPCSGSALDAVIKEAYDAGIPVIIVQDGPVTSEYCYQLLYDLPGLGKICGDYLVETCGKEATWLVMRGVSGNEYDIQVMSGYQQVIDENNINVAAELYAEWSHTIAQQQVSQTIYSLPEIDGVATQGGDAYGVAMAFEAAGLEVPVIIGGNRGYFLNWWYEKSKETGYTTKSITIDPQDDSYGLYTIVDILNGHKIEQHVYLDFVEVTQDTLEQFAGMPNEEVACYRHDQEWVRENIVLANAANG